MEKPAGKAPYPSLTAQLGGMPNTNVDVPITCVFLVLFVCGAISHMTIFQINNRRNHKFIPSAACFGFCMARSLTCALRISLAFKPDNVQLGIAASIFVAAGVLILFILNLLFAQRCLRAAHPTFGWNFIVSKVFQFFYLLIIGILVMVITATVYTHYTLEAHKLSQCRDLLLVGGTYMAWFSFLPFPVLALVLLLPRRSPSFPAEQIGITGSFNSKLWIIGTAALLLCAGASFRDAVNFMPIRPASNPHTIQNKPCFYIFIFTLEILVVYMFLITRIDRMFWVPDGSKGTYLQTRASSIVELTGPEKHPSNKTSSSTLMTRGLSA
ncbi:hypothetical protein PISL3812_09724 [Talaromyces islandicus]|uniref:Uncharacterized protein n=1 Tax=Talaromyces islandicus TaxID=28573 RepID=A0A0U1MCE0_TALIS|nr:hypothetical protein PISL3812_09724 [Talaromyces islandicus]